MARTTTLNNGAATVGYEAQIWRMADAPRGSMDGAEYKHVCLGQLIGTMSNIKIEMLETYCSRVYDPWLARSSGMFVQSVEFTRAHARGHGHVGNGSAKVKADISIYARGRTTPPGAWPA